ncbi:MAG: hypothetical protein RRC34_04235 [Lentisphaeria bacterium]|nr:hypothetical protein [Lentisphaeria bacterium]
MMTTSKKILVGVTLVVWAVSLSVVGPLFFQYWVRCEITLDDRPFTETELAAVEKYLEGSIWLPEKRTVTRIDGSNPPTFVLRMKNVNVDNVKWLLCEQMGDSLSPQERPWEGSPDRHISIRFFPYLSPVGVVLMFLVLSGAFWIGRRSAVGSRKNQEKRGTESWQ